MSKGKSIHIQWEKETVVVLESAADLSEAELQQFARLQESILDALASITKSRWKLGDAVTAWWYERGDEANRQRIALLKEWTEKVLQPKHDVGWETIRTYALVAQVWKPQDRIASYSVHRELIAAENRHLIRAGMSISEAQEAKRAASKARLDERLDGQTLPRRTPDTPFEDKDRESGHDVVVPKGPNAADVRFERNRLEDMFEEAVELFHEIAESLPNVAGVVIEDEIGWPPPIDVEGKVGWNRLLDNSQVYLASIRSTIDNPTSFDDGLAQILGDTD